MFQNIYFDCSSTTMPYPEVLETFQKVSTQYFANPSSNHALGYQSSNILEKARGQIAKYLHCLSEEVIFTSGATEGNNLAIKGVSYHNKGWANRIITTKGEHPSVLNVFMELEKEGFEVVYLDYDKNGNLDLNQLENSLNERTSLVSVMQVNNEVGFVFPIDKVYQIVHQKSKALLHVDATQALCKIDLPKEYDLLSFSGHKIGCVKGSGALIKKKQVMLDEQMLGGSQEYGLRAGTSFMGSDCALATALRISYSKMETRTSNVKKLNSYLRDGLSKIDEVKILTPIDATPYILNFALLKHKGSVVAEALSNEGIYVSTKSACSSKEPGMSYVIKGCGYDDLIASNSIRLSFSGDETIDQADIFLQTLKRILDEIKIKE